ncbi:MAG: response regulator transcription factor [Turicibacter sp.]
MSTIMIVEDDVMLNNGISFNFQMDGFEVVCAFNLKEASNYLKKQSIELIILDVNLPDGSGFDFCKKVRETYDMPILFLTACDLELDMMTGFRLGGDDYVTKPFSVNILRERVLALLRRYQGTATNQQIIKVDEFEIDLKQMTVTKQGKLIDLAPTEYKLFLAFVESRGEVLTRQFLLDVLWEKDNFVEEHALTVNINRLRNKIENLSSKPVYIKTVYGIGYVWGGKSS